MIAEAATDVTAGLLATGITVGTGVATSQVRSYLRRDQVSVDLGEVATEFNKALEQAIEAENERRNTKELAGFTDNWQAIAEELAATPAAPDVETRRDAEEVDILFIDEDDAVTRIAEAYSTVQDIPLDRMPQAREAIEDALTRAYRRAVENFQKRIDGTDLERQLEAETNLVLAERLADLQNRLEMMEEDVAHLLTQEARNEGFRQFSRAFFARQSPSPELCWRVGMSLADVEAGIPAEREGRDRDPASDELLDILRGGENRMVVGRPGSGKSTLCKQVAVRWYEDDDLGAVMYRETGSTQFTSTDDLARAIERAEKPVLVVVEDAVREGANNIAETIEEFEDAPGVRFLLDARREELDEFDAPGSLDVSAHRRRGSKLENVTEYSLSRLSVDDIERVCEAFTAATGRSIRRDPETLRDELRPDEDIGIGEMLLLAFLLPAGFEQEEAGLEAHVRARWETLNPKGDESLRDLSEFDEDLLADVGAMVNLLNASGIGIHQELVHALAYEHGHDIETHDTIEEVLQSLERWMLFPDESEGGSWTTHPLWSALYLRELAIEHSEDQESSQRRERSEERVGTCLESLFRLFDDAEHRNELAKEFPGPTIIEGITAEPQQRAEEYLEAVFELGAQWPALAPLFGTIETARYELPDTASETAVARVIYTRGNAHFSRGAYAKAGTEYEHGIKQSREIDQRHGVAANFNNLGLVYSGLGDYEEAQEYFDRSLDISLQLDNRLSIAITLVNVGILANQQGSHEVANDYHNLSLELFEELRYPQGIANIFNNLGLVAHERGAYEDVRKYYERSLDIKRELNDRQGIANTLGNLGSIALEQGACQDARKYYKQSLDIKRKLGDRQGIANTLHNLGSVAFEQGTYEDARKYYERSLDIEQELNNQQGILTSLINLGSVAFKKGAYRDAQKYYEQSIDINRKLGDRRGIANCCQALGAASFKQSAYKNARNYYDRSRTIFRELGAVRNELMRQLDLVKLEIEAGEPERARTQCKAARERLDNVDRDFHTVCKQLEQVCTDIPEE